MRNDEIYLVPGVPTLLTNAAVTALRVKNRSQYMVELQATNGTTAPASFDGSVPLEAGDMLLASDKVSVIWPGVAGANHVWALTRQSGVVLSVSHADA